MGSLLNVQTFVKWYIESNASSAVFQHWHLRLHCVCCLWCSAELLTTQDWRRFVCLCLYQVQWIDAGAMLTLINQPIVKHILTEFRSYGTEKTFLTMLTYR